MKIRNLSTAAIPNVYN